MNEWVNVTDSFSESQRHYKNTYLEICEVFDEVVEVSLFSSHMKSIFHLGLCMESSMRGKGRRMKNGSR